MSKIPQNPSADVSTQDEPITHSDNVMPVEDRTEPSTALETTTGATASQKPKRGVLRWIAEFFIWLIPIFVLIVAGLVLVVPKVWGQVASGKPGTADTVLTPSMEPNINRGDMVAIVPVQMKDINVGDVVQYHPYPKGDPNESMTVTHRVISKTAFSSTKAMFRVKGDNNSVMDPQVVNQDMITGKVMYRIPKMGWMTPAGGHPGVVYGIAGGILVFGLILIFKPSKKE